MLSEHEIVDMLAGAQSIAVVGASSSPARDSHTAVTYLRSAGFKVFPVNPTEREVAGLPVLQSVTDLPEPVDIVNVFRRPEFCAGHAREAAEMHAPYLWLQLGITSDDAERIAAEGGIGYIEDRCLFSTHRMLARRGVLEAPATVLEHLTADERFSWAGISWVMGDGEVAGPSVGARPRPVGAAALPSEPGVAGSRAFAPIRRDGAVIGTLEAGSDEQEPLDPEQLELVKAAADRLSR